MALVLTEDEAYDLVVAVAAGELVDVADIARRLHAGVRRVRLR